MPRAAALALSAALVATLTCMAGWGQFANGATDVGRVAQADSRPNIILLETDDQALESMRVLPNVRRLIGDAGATFDRSFVSFSLCCPSRATVLTGQYAHNHGVQGNSPPVGGYYKLRGANTLPVWLKQAGYATVHLGKYLNGYGKRNKTEIPPGWTEWHGLVDPSTYKYYDYTFNDNGTLNTFGTGAANYQTDVIASRAQEIVRRRAASYQPFFLWTAFLAPHSGGPREANDPSGGTPVPAPRHQHSFDREILPRPPSFNEADVSDKPLGVRRRPLLTQSQIRYIAENYRQRLESLLAVDDAVAGIVNALTQTGELDNTLIIFTSDNGYFHGEHRIASGKIHVYEPSVRVPLLMRGPGIPRGIHLPQPVANIDLAPTIVDAAGAHAGLSVDGRSLLDLTRDPKVEWGRDILLEAYPGAAPVVAYHAIRTRRYLYARYGNNEREFYDLTNDPDELHSSSTAANRRRRSSLLHRLERLQTCAGSRCRAHPRLVLRLSYRRGRTTTGQSCAAGPVLGRVRGNDRKSVQRVSFYVAGRRARTDGHSPFSTRLGLSRFTSGALTTVRARATVKYDRLYTMDRSVTRC